MNYQSFLFVLNQLRAGRPAHFEWEGLVITFEKIDGNPRGWRFSTILFQAEDRIPPHVQSCVFSSGILRWQTHGAFLKCNPKLNAILLVQELDHAHSFIAFRRTMQDFAALAKEWKTVLASLGAVV